ncbi:MAG TPA: N-acetylmuramoyl-L-alanine amidase [Pilimelia sp.]|nr:N-acetylmuramoyl-L-alanine amidase [Pilimelia sp.]
MAGRPAALPGRRDRPAGATRLRLGDFHRPAAGVRRAAALPRGARINPEAAEGRAAGAAPHTLTLRRATTAEFSAIGVTWRAGRPAAVSVAARVRRGGRWTAWRDVGPGEAGRAGTGLRDGAELQWWGPATGVEVAVTALDRVAPRDIAVDLIDPGRRSADRLVGGLPGGPAAEGGPGGPAAGSVADGELPRAAPDPGALVRAARAAPAPYLNPRVLMPRILRRASWGADPRKMTWRPELLPQVKAGALHHTATTNSYTAGQVPAILRAIYHFHAVSRGWGDIGYTVLVDRFGRLWEGRAGGVAASVVGGHTGGFNNFVAGVSMIGNYGSAAVTRTMVESIARYLAWRFTLGPHADPRGTVRLVGGGYGSRYRPGTAITVPRIFPHRRTNPTECPGARGVAALPAIRARTASIMGGWVVPTRPRVRMSVFRPATGQWFVRGVTGALVRGARGYTPVPADYDGDGTTDLALYRQATRTWRIWQSHTRRPRTVVLGGWGQLPAPADLDGDGVTEPMTFEPATGLWRRRGAADVRWGGAPGDVPVPADYTGDGRADIAFYRPASRSWFVARAAAVPFGAVGDRPAPADYNGDGRVDPAAWNTVTDRVTVRVHPARTLVLPPNDTPLYGQYNGDLVADPLSWGIHGGAARFLFQGRWVYRFGIRGDVPLALT